MSARETIEQQAALWLARRENGACRTGDQAAFEAWLAASPTHKVTYWRLEQAWKRIDGPLSEPSVTTPLERLTQSVPSRRRVAGAAVAAGLALALGMWGGRVHLLSPRSDQAIQTETGGRNVTALTDGSSVELNAETRVRTRIGDRRREVWLDKGEAYFDVAHDPSRPFVVHAGSRAITVLGTRFSVKRIGDKITVAVRAGKVRVDGERSAARPLFLKPGEIAVSDGGSILVAAQSAEKVEEALSWRTGFITFDKTTLAEAAREFNRHNARPLVVAPELADLRVSGVFEARNAAAFARLMRDGLDLKVVDDGEKVTISR